jgi:hypothetical protein
MIRSRWWPFACAVVGGIGMLMVISTGPATMSRSINGAVQLSYELGAAAPSGLLSMAQEWDWRARVVVEEMLAAPRILEGEFTRSGEAIRSSDAAEVYATGWLHSEGVHPAGIEDIWVRRIIERELQHMETYFSGVDRNRAIWTVFFKVLKVGSPTDGRTASLSDGVNAGYVTYDAQSGQRTGFSGQDLAFTREPAATLRNYPPDKTYGLDTAQHRLAQLATLILLAMILGFFAGYAWRRHALRSS